MGAGMETGVDKMIGAGVDRTEFPFRLRGLQYARPLVQQKETPTGLHLHAQVDADQT